MFAAYKKFWTHYADFSGRSSRSDYWWAFLCNMIIIVPLFIIIWVSALGSIFSVAQDAAYGYEPDPSAFLAGAGFAVIFWFILLIYYLAILVPSMAIIVRRLRDAGYHWAFLFLYVGPLVLLFVPVLKIIAGIVVLPCFIALIVLLCQGSKPEMVGNSYGQQYGQQNFQGQQFGQSQQPVQNQQFGQQPQQPVQNQSFGQQPQQPVQNQSFGQQPQQPVQNQPFGQQPQQPVQNQPFGQQPQQGGFQGQQFAQQPQQPVQNQPFGQQPQQGGFQEQQFGQQPQQPVSDQSQAVEQAEPVQNPFTAETPEQSTPEDFGTQAPVEDNPFVSPIQEEQPATPVENNVDDATENQE
ncbi:DUF805 domain-containing protein [uncultured Streptococcus sp.]|uniref:DUF805 domain-containing protein n=1 Tax=uncultured Streptococcus sp. TaxID=83427 RepID=UPI0025DB8D27|nr:DUF805 domain-containing protein [uncultured Streptococcus sp.]